MHTKVMLLTNQINAQTKQMQELQISTKKQIAELTEANTVSQLVSRMELFEQKFNNMNTTVDKKFYAGLFQANADRVSKIFKTIFINLPLIFLQI
jgi:Tfp pilus assembly protein PilN